MICTAAFDNSPDNLANPDPTKTVTWGDQSWEEMMIGFFDTVPDDTLPDGSSCKRFDFRIEPTVGSIASDASLAVAR